MQLWQRQEYETRLSSVVERTTQVSHHRNNISNINRIFVTIININIVITTIVILTLLLSSSFHHHQPLLIINHQQEQRDHDYAMSLQQQLLQQQQQPTPQQPPLQATNLSTGGNNVPVYGTPVAGPPGHLMQPSMPPTVHPIPNGHPNGHPSYMSANATANIQQPQLYQQQLQQPPQIYHQQPQPLPQQMSSSVPAQQYGQYPVLNAPSTTTTSTTQAYPVSNHNTSIAYPPALSASSSSGPYMSYPAMPPPAQVAQHPHYPHMYPQNSSSASTPSGAGSHQLPPSTFQQHQQVPNNTNPLEMQRKVDVPTLY